ncbi:MAG: pantetheine-phosphate adenylyltransferase [Bacteroides sp.]|nr:pantetheine-phosphate adenylyltransferase [Prevotella sp.]MCM1408230.1 pantetheine-phosphate adenylyltransferase [Treponema brennaborense]MCM1469554.1 pantetheine-phosphate adenylyltransferase [Bacteroides sp.]
MMSAVFAGSFDPPTYGHLNIVERARAIFSEIHVVVAVNNAKQYLFSDKERFDMMSRLVESWDNVKVHLCDKLIVEYAKELNASVLLRGVRNTADFSYELDLSLLNKGLDPHIETVFFPTDHQYFILKSSAIKELASFGGDVSKMVPPLVEKELKKKYNR